MQPGKYTALEILQAIGTTFQIGEGEGSMQITAEEAIGLVRVRIGGIAGINTLDHKIRLNFENNVETVIVGATSYEITKSEA